jgi:hypothetical protein
MSPSTDAKPQAQTLTVAGGEPRAEIFFAGSASALTPIARPGKRTGIDQRRARRQRVSKTAELVCSLLGTPIECEVIDETRFGVMLETPVRTDVPERVEIRFVGGPTFAALRRWASGNKVGLEFVGLFLEDEATIGQVRMIRTVLKEVGVHAAVQMLRERDFFQSSQLRTAAEEAEIAIARLESALV